MKPNNQKRIWIEILATGTAVGCGIAFMIATLGAAAFQIAGEPAFAGVRGDSPAQQIYEGMLTCSRCGAKHSATLGKNAADCVRICAHLGAHFTLLDVNNVYQLDGESDVLKQLAARRVRVAGVLEGRTIHVSSIAAAD